jgi:hypothetical protein
MTVVKMREHLKDIDFSGRTKLSFIEYLMFKYHKSLAQLFAPPPAVRPLSSASIPRLAVCVVCVCVSC